MKVMEALRFCIFLFFLRIGGVEVEWRKNEVEIWDLQFRFPGFYCFVRDFCLGHIYFLILKLKGHEFYLFIYFLVGQYLNILEEESHIYMFVFRLLKTQLD